MGSPKCQRFKQGFALIILDLLNVGALQLDLHVVTNIWIWPGSKYVSLDDLKVSLHQNIEQHSLGPALYYVFSILP